MKKQQEAKQTRGIFGWVLFALVSLLFLAFLELNKQTLLGWALALLAIARYIFLRSKLLKAGKKGLRVLSFCGLLICFAVIGWVSWPPVQRVPAVKGAKGVTDVVHVAQGDLTGVYTPDGAVEVYTGIPYAQPPVGDLRWKEPQPALPWDGVLKADHFAPMGMQTVNLPVYNSLAQIIGYHDYEISLDDNYRPPVSEDSLYLNIWKPAGSGENLPVLVYIHGGSLQTGQPWYADYRGEGLARQGVVAVNLGYRLGIFGFFADEELAAESPNGTTGNYGLLDQIAALQWVRDNIAAFGGDPDNVTLAGESAGSACVSALCTSPLAKGLFRRVLAESSTVTAPDPTHSYRTMDQALKDGAATKSAFGAKDIAALRALPAEKIVGELNRHHHMTVDGYVLPEAPSDAYKNGHFNEEAQLQGFNREESAPFILFGQANLKNYETMVRRMFGGIADEVLALYPASTDAEAKQNWADLYTVYYFTYGHHCWALQAEANGIPSYEYHFTKANGRLGSWHSGEEVYFYGNIPEASALYDEKDRALSRTITQYVLNFMKTGDPNGDGLPQWETAGKDARLMELGDTVGMTDTPYQALYAVMDAAN